MRQFEFPSGSGQLRIPYFVMDVFADKQFHGSPTGVCLLYHEWPEQELLIKIAAENALPITAFILVTDKGYALRWCAPNMEIDLCGHATIGAAAVVSEFLGQKGEIIFDWSGGQIFGRKLDDFFEVDLPARPLEPYELTDQMVKALGGALPSETYASRDLVFIFPDAEAVRSLEPDFSTMVQIEYGDGVIVSAPGTDSDLVVRAFFPKQMTDEDPVCGSAHCNLIPYWSQKLGKKELVSHQLSQRQGYLRCRNKDDQVGVAGQIVMYSIGEIAVKDELLV